MAVAMVFGGGFDSPAVYFIGTMPLFYSLAGGWPGAFTSASGLLLVVTIVYTTETYGIALQQTIPEPLLHRYLYATWAIINGLGMAWFYEFLTTAHMDEVQNELEQRKLVEQSLRESEAAKDVFLAYMSHEIRNPMASILASVDLLEMPEFEGKREHYTGVLKRSAHNLRDLLDHVLDFSKIESGRIELQSCSFSLWSLIAELEQEFEIQAQGSGLAFSVIREDDVVDQVVADPVRLRQVLFNLLSNAVKFTDSGTIALEVKNSDGGVYFGVRDTGMGIPAEDQRTVFEPYRQLRANVKRRRGMGLGLPICKRVVTLMGGELSLESSGEGSRFYFCIDFERGTEPSIPSILRRRVRPNSVLVVEDNEAYRFILGEMLEIMGLNVTREQRRGGCSGSRVQEFDLIIMDLNMPIMDGFQASNGYERTSGSRASRVKLLAISGNQFKGVEECCANVGIDRLLSKPVSQAVLSETVRLLLSPVEAA